MIIITYGGRNKSDFLAQVNASVKWYNDVLTVYYYLTDPFRNVLPFLQLNPYLLYKPNNKPLGSV